ncbi:MAG: hypothetical protein ACRDP6_41185, partial [Actinoallomurus sp.]
LPVASLGLDRAQRFRLAMETMPATREARVAMAEGLGAAARRLGVRLVVGEITDAGSGRPGHPGPELRDAPAAVTRPAPPGALDPPPAVPDPVARVERPGLPGARTVPDLAPDRYGTPLQRADGTRTPLFTGEPTREQTELGALGDHALISVFGGVAGHRPELIRDVVRETGDGDYEVRLHETTYSPRGHRTDPTGRRVSLTVTPDLPVFADAPERPAFAAVAGAAWPAILEKAFAGIEQTWGAERRAALGDGGGYPRIGRDNGLREQVEMLTLLTGLPAKVWKFSGDSLRSSPTADRRLLNRFRELLRARNPIFVSTRDRYETEPPLVKDLMDHYGYEITLVDARGLFHLRSPWNGTHPEPLTIDELRANVLHYYLTFADPIDRGGM